MFARAVAHFETLCAEFQRHDPDNVEHRESHRALSARKLISDLRSTGKISRFDQ